MTSPEPEDGLSDRWIFDTNLRPLCASLADFAGYDFDDSDWQAIETALPRTNVEQDAWYDYPLLGRVPLTLHIAADPGSSVEFVRVVGVSDDRTRARTEAALHIFATWEVT